MLNVSRVFEGRYVTLLSQWKYANTYPQYKEQLSAANIYVSVLSSDNPGKTSIHIFYYDIHYCIDNDDNGHDDGGNDDEDTEVMILKMLRMMT
jgi:hypothetical protein